jgi:hypothetical protein
VVRGHGGKILTTEITEDMEGRKQRVKAARADGRPRFGAGMNPLPSRIEAFISAYPKPSRFSASRSASSGQLRWPPIGLDIRKPAPPHAIAAQVPDQFLCQPSAPGTLRVRKYESVPSASVFSDLAQSCAAPSVASLRLANGHHATASDCLCNQSHGMTAQRRRAALSSEWRTGAGEGARLPANRRERRKRTL